MTEVNETDYCQDILLEHWPDCEERKLPRNWGETRERLIARRAELIDVYKDVLKQTGGNKLAIQLFFDSIICARSAWHPEATFLMRDDYKKLTQVTDRISKLSSELADLLEKKSEIENRNSFGSDTHYSITDVIEDASSSNYLFISWVKSHLNNLSSQFDLKYWPSLADVFRTISRSHHQAKIEIYDDVTAAALASQRHSKADFCRALFQRVADEVYSSHSALPKDFHLSDENWASVINCVLDLTPDELIDGAYIKRQRQSSKSLI
ncbi:hypothetical protein [Pacificibacter sp. AS14]|uniref:hypothetical protein n=1 Tax=Pacificibacter sp. AS14 TaxID=3135785 RepID=UPI00317C899E